MNTRAQLPVLQNVGKRVNLALRRVGVQIVRAKAKKQRGPADFVAGYERDLARARLNRRGFGVHENFQCDIGVHPVTGSDVQCAFAAEHLHRQKPERLLDVGSHRQFLLGLMAHRELWTVDVRAREPALANEHVVVSDAKRLALPDESFDGVVSLCALEHFGLGRYGDEYDEDGDLKAFREMVRVLRPGGTLIFTTTVTAGEPVIAFNAHRVYSVEMLRELEMGLETLREDLYSRRLRRVCSPAELTRAPGETDLYLGAFRKPGLARPVL